MKHLPKTTSRACAVCKGKAQYLIQGVRRTRHGPLYREIPVCEDHVWFSMVTYQGHHWENFEAWDAIERMCAEDLFLYES